MPSHPCRSRSLSAARGVPGAPRKRQGGGSGQQWPPARPHWDRPPRSVAPRAPCRQLSRELRATAGGCSYRFSSFLFSKMCQLTPQRAEHLKPLMFHPLKPTRLPQAPLGSATGSGHMDVPGTFPSGESSRLFISCSHCHVAAGTATSDGATAPGFPPPQAPVTLRSGCHSEN